MTNRIHTVKGAVETDSLGLILPHEHLFTDLRGPHIPDYAQGEASAVVQVVGPHLADAAAVGVTALVVALLALDLGVVNRRAHVLHVRFGLAEGDIARDRVVKHVVLL